MKKIGIIGAGRWSTPYALGAQAAGAKIVGIYTLDESAGKLAERIGSEAPTDPGKLIEQSDCVLIGSPTDTHLDYLLMAAEAGKPALCASPAIVDTAQLSKLQGGSACAHAYSSFPLRARAEYSRLKSAVASGDLGTIGIYRFGMCQTRPTGWRADSNRSGGPLLETGVHLLDWLEWVAGPIERIYGAASSAAENPYTLLVAKMAEGSIAHLEISWTEPDGASFDYYEVAGSNGLLEYDSRTAPLMVVDYHDGNASDSLSPGASAAQLELQGLLNQLESGKGGFTSMDHGLGVCKKAICIKAAIVAGEVLTF